MKEFFKLCWELNVSSPKTPASFSSDAQGSQVGPLTTFDQTIVQRPPEEVSKCATTLLLARTALFFLGPGFFYVTPGPGANKKS